MQTIFVLVDSANHYCPALGVFMTNADLKVVEATIEEVRKDEVYFTDELAYALQDKGYKCRAIEPTELNF